MATAAILRTAKGWSKPPLTAALLAAGYYSRRARQLPRDRAVILLYHHVTKGDSPGVWSPFQRGVDAARFEQQMRFLERTMAPMPLRRLVACLREGRPLPRRAVAVTFDDGYLDNYTVAFPVLRRYGIPATAFVTTAFIGGARSFWWDDVYAMFRDATAPALAFAALDAMTRSASHRAGALSLRNRTARARAADVAIDRLRGLTDDERPQRLDVLRAMLRPGATPAPGAPPMMTWAHLQEMSAHGVTVESHTHSHPILGRSPGPRVKEELALSKQLIEQRLGQAVEGIAYPDGREGTFDDGTATIVETTGYRFACVTLPHPVAPGADIFRLGRMPVGNPPFPVFVRDLLTAYGFAERS